MLSRLLAALLACHCVYGTVDVYRRGIPPSDALADAIRHQFPETRRQFAWIDDAYTGTPNSPFHGEMMIETQDDVLASDECLVYLPSHGRTSISLPCRHLNLAGGHAVVLPRKCHAWRMEDGRMMEEFSLPAHSLVHVLAFDEFDAEKASVLSYRSPDSVTVFTDCLLPEGITIKDVFGAIQEPPVVRPAPIQQAAPLTRPLSAMSLADSSTSLSRSRSLLRSRTDKVIDQLLVKPHGSIAQSLQTFASRPEGTSIASVSLHSTLSEKFGNKIKTVTSRKHDKMSAVEILASGSIPVEDYLENDRYICDPSAILAVQTEIKKGMDHVKRTNLQMAGSTFRCALRIVENYPGIQNTLDEEISVLIVYGAVLQMMNPPQENLARRMYEKAVALLYRRTKTHGPDGLHDFDQTLPRIEKYGIQFKAFLDNQLNPRLQVVQDVYRMIGDQFKLVTTYFLRSPHYEIKTYLSQVAQSLATHFGDMDSMYKLSKSYTSKCKPDGSSDSFWWCQKALHVLAILSDADPAVTHYPHIWLYQAHCWEILAVVPNSRIILSFNPSILLPASYFDLYERWYRKMDKTHADYRSFSPFETKAFKEISARIKKAH